jgi:glutamate formiminotransferase/formiminotetrahydrofolate cyclodeaminase
MSSPLVECIPNFSEARHPEVIQALLSVVESAHGVYLLDTHSDKDHNRTVITFAGAPETVKDTAFRLIALAADLIDLNQHSGVHPRIGATDVVPFVPLRGITMEECVQMAYSLGERVGNELGLPVYLYEQAATSVKRQNLENIRRGQYELLREEIKNKPERAPDYGPLTLGPAGAVAIGARNPLIAFNINLNTRDIKIARLIARKIRFSSGGLKYVKALGFIVHGYAQVSINLTNYLLTPISQVFELVQKETAQLGVSILHSEIVGLIPEDALLGAGSSYLQLKEFNNDQILEFRLKSSMLHDSHSIGLCSPLSFLNQLASINPAPAGGSAAAFTAAIAASLIHKASLITLTQKKFSVHHPEIQKLSAAAETLQANLLDLADIDSSVFQEWLLAHRKMNLEPLIFTETAESALLKTVNVSLQICRNCLDIIRLANSYMHIGNKNALADVKASVHLAEAALHISATNIRVNIKGHEDFLQKPLAELFQLEKIAEQLEATSFQIFSERILE